MWKLAPLLVALAVLSTAPPAPAGTGETGRSVDAVCGAVSKPLTYLFWPKGHSGMPSAGLPEATERFAALDRSRPLVSVYRVGSDYLDSNWLLTIQILPPAPGDRDEQVALLERRKGSATTKPCPPSHGAKFKFPIAHRKSTTKPTALTCTFRTRYGYVGYSPAKPDMSFRKLKIRAHDKYTVFFEADTTGTPKLTYDTSFCKRIPLPGAGG